nr:hypothetical protein CFP56_20205 [Quercus suber]
MLIGVSSPQLNRRSVSVGDDPGSARNSSSQKVQSCTSTLPHSCHAVETHTPGIAMNGSADRRKQAERCLQRCRTATTPYLQHMYCRLPTSLTGRSRQRLPLILWPDNDSTILVPDVECPLTVLEGVVLGDQEMVGTESSARRLRRPSGEFGTVILAIAKFSCSRFQPNRRADGRTNDAFECCSLTANGLEDALSKLTGWWCLQADNLVRPMYSSVSSPLCFIDPPSRNRASRSDIVILGCEITTDTL